MAGFIFIIFSCDLNTGSDPRNPDSGGLGIPVGARWSGTDIRQSGGSEKLTFFLMKKERANLFSLELERWEEGSSEDEYTIKNRFVLELTTALEGDHLNAAVTGIAQGIHESLKRPGDAEFSSYISQLGYSEVDLTLLESTGSIGYEEPQGSFFRLARRLGYVGESEEQLEHDGEMRTGRYRERLYYYPEGSGFRLYYTWSFSYYNADKKAQVSLSNLFDAYGTRTENSVPGEFDCVITGLSNRATPRYFYSKTKIPDMFKKQIGWLGFDHFAEEQLTDATTMLTMQDENGADYSYELNISPLDE